jgi:hypothetical protein
VTDGKLLSQSQATRRLGIGHLELRRLIRNDQCPAISVWAASFASLLPGSRTLRLVSSQQLASPGTRWEDNSICMAINLTSAPMRQAMRKNGEPIEQSTHFATLPTEARSR